MGRQCRRKPYSVIIMYDYERFQSIHAEVVSETANATHSSSFIFGRALIQEGHNAFLAVL
jgi:hypothetical protein